ncbi:hypothetical protein DFQ27_008410 [Actinomortierella ambigua]|uniref:Uncharacterized protein n=1 Tax=Actinomortierella ambigua TaxID=1343610 RepID=A0A9P6TYU0_9FUNG|nr:hypothetical protein DFQ27_008410 [Actinomortierella ambigua]
MSSRKQIGLKTKIDEGTYLHDLNTSSGVCNKASNTEFSGKVDEDIFCWPQTDKLAAIATHIHAEVLYSIWRTYTAVHKLQPGQQPRGCKADDLLWLTVNSLKTRARTALTEAKLKDSGRRPTEADSTAASDLSYQWMRRIWHRPPHIVVTTEEAGQSI